MSALEPTLPSPQPLLELETPTISIPTHVESFEEYFQWMATAASIKSKDPKCPVGAVIVSDDNVLLSTGFNGFVRGMHDDQQSLDDPKEKLRFVCHAEQNAILNAARIGARALQGSTIYVTKFPCLSCCLEIVQAGIKKIYTHDDSFWNDDPEDADHTRKRRVLHEAKIEVIAPYHPAFLPPRIITPKKPPVRATLPQDVKKTAI